MSHTRNSRRDFLRTLGCLACSGGASSLLPQMRMMGTALADTKSLPGYRALVCLYFAGGNDAWNLLVPFDNARYTTYATSRSGVYDPVNNGGGLGLPQPSTQAQINAQKIIDGNDANSSTNQYFLNAAAPELAALFKGGNLGFVVNAGTLVRPITMTDYLAGSTNYPAQLFSHADQTNQWQQGYAVESSSLGWGGQCGDVLGSNNGNQQLSPCISIAGANRFEVGVGTVPYQLSSNGLTTLKGMCNTNCNGTNKLRDTALNDLLGATYANDFATGYSSVFGRGRDLYSLLSPDLAAYAPKTVFPSGSLGSQLATVASMINLCAQKGYASRQIYFVQLGGFDLHSGMMSGAGDHASLLTQASAAMDKFYTAMGPGDVNLQDSVTLFTMSEFARTLQSNGSGSDHAWGSVHMVMGGAVNGGKLYSNGGGPISGFPNQALNAPNNFARGQMIPGIGVEQYAATLAQWMGVTSTTDLHAIFPNLGGFAINNLGFV
jgi:uncharacterized protein (DUF1501 family)